ncbi:MAG: type II toxin-antitoxin system HicA family toxin [Bryobacterales bacterium]|nr:type II toxin-antitoxin system HicA family toxin [Bryobacterales bacterium]
MPKLNPLDYRTLVCIFERDGFRQVRQEGSHIVLKKAGMLRPLVIPAYGTVPVFIIRNNMRTAGMDRERFFQLLKECL